MLSHGEENGRCSREGRPEQDAPGPQSPWAGAPGPARMLAHTRPGHSCLGASSKMEIRSEGAAPGEAGSSPTPCSSTDLLSFSPRRQAASTVLCPPHPVQAVSFLGPRHHGPPVAIMVPTFCASLLFHQFTTRLPQDPRPHEDRRASGPTLIHGPVPGTGGAQRVFVG